MLSATSEDVVKLIQLIEMVKDNLIFKKDIKSKYLICEIILTPLFGEEVKPSQALNVIDHILSGLTNIEKKNDDNLNAINATEVVHEDHHIHSEIIQDIHSEIIQEQVQAPQP